MKLMTIKIDGSLSPSDSKIVKKIEEFEVPESISEIHLKFDYIPRRIESLENGSCPSFNVG
jgi:hypothetical protein